MTVAQMPVSTARAKAVTDILSKLQRGKTDHQYFCQTFLGRTLHDKQLEWMQNASATINALATANRFGKTFLLPARHFHSCIYKLGAEPRYKNDDGTTDVKRFLQVKYQTVHTAGSWETAALVFEESHKILGESAIMRRLVKHAPRSAPPHIEFTNGAKWKFRTLGHDASGIDGNSFYYISIDEAGWIDDLDEKMRNVIRVRVADVRGRIDIVGTFKPGISQDFYRYCIRAAGHIGLNINFDHREGGDGPTRNRNLDASVRRYLAEYGIDLDEYADAIGG